MGIATLCDKCRKWPSPLKGEKWMRVATLPTLGMCGTCEGDDHPVSKKSTVHSGTGLYNTECYSMI